MILQKYLITRCFGITAIVTLMLFTIALVTQFNLQLKSVLSGLLNIELLLPSLLYLSPSYLSIVFPISFFVALIITLSLMHNSNELMVMRSCGVSRNRLCLLFLPLIVVFFVFALVLNLFLVPASARAIADVLRQQDNSDVFSAIRSHRFLDIGYGRTLHIQEMNEEENTLGEVYIFDDNRADGSSLIYAQRAQVHNNADRYMTLQDGYLTNLDDSQVSRTDFLELSIRLPQPKSIVRIARAESFDNATLLASSQPEVYQLFFWRLSLSLLIPIFFITIIYLFSSKPRSSHSVNFLVFFTLGMCYMGATVAVSSFVSRGYLSAEAGYSLVHAAMLLFVYVIHKQKSMQGQ